MAWFIKKIERDLAQKLRLSGLFAALHGILCSPMVIGRAGVGYHPLRLLSSSFALSANRMHQLGHSKIASYSARYSFYLAPTSYRSIAAGILYGRRDQLESGLHQSIARLESGPAELFDLLLRSVYDREGVPREDLELLVDLVSEQQRIIREYFKIVLEILLRQRDVSHARAIFKQLARSSGSDLGVQLSYIQFLYHRGYYAEALALIDSLAAGRTSMVGRIKQKIEVEMELLRAPLVDDSVKSVANYSAISGCILHVVGGALPFERSGYSYRTHAIVQAQRDAGLLPIVVVAPTIRAVKPQDRVVELDGVTYIRLSATDKEPLSLSYSNFYQDELLKVVEQHRPAVIHAASYFINALPALRVARAVGVPFLYELRGLWEDTMVAEGMIGADSDRYELQRAIEAKCLQEADGVVTLSETQQGEIAKRGVAADKIVVVPNGVDTQLITQKGGDRYPAEIPAEWLADRKLVFGYIGSMAHYEGLELLLRAFAELNEPGARLLLVGDGSERERLMILSRKLKVQERVVFTGRVAQDKVGEFFSLIDVFVLPRLPYRVCEYVSPIKPFEAMASGTPLLASDLKVLREVLGYGERGELFKAGSIEALMEKMREMASTPESYADKVESARDWVRRERDWKVLGGSYRDFYCRILDS